MQQALEILAEFSTFSGPEINRMKSEAMWLGSKQNCTDTFFGFVWKKRLTILGVYFACDKCDRPPRNESEVPSGCLELEWKMGVGGVRCRF